MKRFKDVHRHLLIGFSMSVVLCCLALSPAVRAENQSTSQTQAQRSEKQNPLVRRATLRQQKKRVERRDGVKRQNPSQRLRRLHASWVRNKAKTQTQRSPEKAARSKTQYASQSPADLTDTPKFRNAAHLSLLTLQLPTPFYADLYNNGNRLAFDVGVEKKNGSIYAFIEEEFTADGITRSIGIGSHFRLNHDGTFFIRARDVLHFVPKKIGTGVHALGRGIKALRWW